MGKCICYSIVDSRNVRHSEIKPGGVKMLSSAEVFKILMIHQENKWLCCAVEVDSMIEVGEAPEKL